jgi:oxygen-dependent protoporphyrinogen oxidase
MQKFIIVGGGISGLSAAYFLAKKSLQDGIPRHITLIQGAQPGGWLKTITQSNTLFETGPRSLRPAGSGITTLEVIKEIGLENELLVVDGDSPAVQNRFIYYKGQLNNLSSNIIKTIFSKDPLLKGFVKNIIMEPFKSKSKLNDESISDFVTRRLGKSTADNMLSAVVHGIHAGDIRKLSIKSTFPSLWNMEKSGSITLSILKSLFKPTKPIELSNEANREFVETLMKKRMYSFKNGMQTLSDQLLKKIIKMGVLVIEKPATSIEFGNLITVKVDVQEYKCDHIINALPSTKLSKLLPSTNEYLKLKNALESIQAVDVAVVNLVYPPNVLKIQGFGFLVPISDQDLNVIGVVFDSCSFPEHNNNTILTAMMGGHAFERFGKNADFVDLAAADIEKVLGLKKELIQNSLVSIQRECIPQYVVGHSEKLKVIYEEIKKLKRVSVTGASYEGVSINDCIHNAKLLVNTLK